MTIINQTANLTNDRKTAYNMAAGAAVRKMRECKGQIITIAAMLLYEDVDTNGQVQTVISIKTSEGDIYATNSPSFVRDIGGMCAIFGFDGVKAIKVVPMSSKAGREYIRAELVEAAE